MDNESNGFLGALKIIADHLYFERAHDKIFSGLMGWYTLDENKNPVRCGVFAANHMLGSPDKIVKQEWINGVKVSTVFLVLDHNLNGHGAPILFETMTFTGRKGSLKKLDQWTWRYCTWEQAERGHAIIRELIKRKNLTGLTKPRERWDVRWF